MLMGDKDASRLTFYLVLKFILFICDIMYGLAYYSLESILQAMHLSFDCLALIVALSVLLLSKRPPKFAYTYGLARFEVVGAFCVSSFLIFLSAFYIMEALHHSLSEEAHTLLPPLLSFMSICINFVGLALFMEHSKLVNQFDAYRHSTSGGRNLNMHAVFCHVLCDAISQVSSLFIAHSDSSGILSFVLASMAGVIMIRINWPVLRESSLLVLQTSPQALKTTIDRCMRQIAISEGVLECRNVHWWSQSPGEIVATFNVRCRPDADEQAILVFANVLLGKFVTHLTIQLDKDTSVDWGVTHVTHNK